MYSACDIVEVAYQCKLPVDIVGQVYFDLGDRLHMNWVRQQLRNLSNASYWQRVSNRTLLDELFEQQKRLTHLLIKQLCTNTHCIHAVDRWMEQNHKRVVKYNQFISELRSHDEYDMAMLVVAIRKIKEISYAYMTLVQ